MDEKLREELRALRAATTDAERPDALDRRRSKGYRTARQNLADLVDPDSFVEYGQMAVAAQRGRRPVEDLRRDTPTDGVITGLATINAEIFGESARAAVAINDYTVLAGTQGFFHHAKLDRLLELARKQSLPIVMYTEGGGGRPGDTDVTTQIAGLNLSTFARWSGLSGHVPRIAVNNGYCFAGNAALFGSADLRIATRTSWIGMAGPAMIEGGGLGRFEPTQIGPAEQQFRNGVVDVLADEEADATRRARRLLAYFQGPLDGGDAGGDPETLPDLLPEDRRYSYHVRRVIETLVDRDSFSELTAGFGGALVTGFARVNGRPLGLLASDCRVLGGAIDAHAARKAARFLRLCNAHGLAVLSLIDTPGFMVGPQSEEQAAVLHMSDLFVAGAQLQVPLIAVVLRKAYGLGAMALAGGSFAEAACSVAWPTGEFGGMGLEGAVRLGYRKELEAEPDPAKREALFEALVAELYEKGRAVEAAAHLEIDGVIDPTETRSVIAHALAAAG